MGDIFLTGQNQYHITGLKKSYFCPTFHLRSKKVFWWVGVVVGDGWKVTLVSICVHFLKLLDTQTQKWTLDTELEKNIFEIWGNIIFIHLWIKYPEELIILHYYFLNEISGELVFFIHIYPLIKQHTFPNRKSRHILWCRCCCVYTRVVWLTAARSCHVTWRTDLSQGFLEQLLGSPLGFGCWYRVKLL